MYWYWYEIFTTFLESVLGVFVICGIGTSLFSTNTLVNINHNYILDRLSKHILYNATFLFMSHNFTLGINVVL